MVHRRLFHGDADGGEVLHQLEEITPVRSHRLIGETSLQPLCGQELLDCRRRGRGLADHHEYSKGRMLSRGK